MSPDSDPDNRAGSHRYEVGPPARCHACTAIARAAEPYTDPDSPTQVPQALRWAATRTLRRHH